ncbi:MAG: polysaccharide biosynthesis/export family protein [Planctomycetes bacterium]|nr:polysaccharide biosynthesis/export family protein [Planctomycetota bacterium]
MKKTELGLRDALQEEGDYKIKSGDTIEISVWGEDMTREIQVRPDGKISYILIGEIEVVGKTFKALKDDIETRLSRYILDPNVTIIGKSFEGNFVSILGAVEKPGRKIVGRDDRVLDVLAKAEGLLFQEQGEFNGEIANLNAAYLSRRGQLMDVDFAKLLQEADMSQNLRIQIGDIIYIPSAFEIPVFITGEVKFPTSMPFRGKPTLMEGITQAGGFNTKAKKSSVYLVRGGLRSPEITVINYHDIISGKVVNPLLEPHDIIYVPPTTLTRVERLSSQIIPFLDTIIGSGSAKNTVRDW